MFKLLLLLSCSNGGDGDVSSLISDDGVDGTFITGRCGMTPGGKYPGYGPIADGGGGGGYGEGG